MIDYLSPLMSKHKGFLQVWSVDEVTLGVGVIWNIGLISSISCRSKNSSSILVWAEIMIV